MIDKSIYENGLRFECQGSGKCCTSHGEFGFVFLTLADRKRFAKFLKLSTSAFTQKYCDKSQGIWHLKEDAKNPDCMFLKEKKCTVYDARPTQCRTWPFWPEVLNAKSWKEDVENFCPGIGKGKLWSKKEIENLIETEKESQKKLGT